MLHISNVQRRARLARRHGLAPGYRYPTVEAATEAMTAWHATEAATVHLALWARMSAVSIDDIDRALYVDRSLVKQLAMRRTLFAFPRDLLPAVWGSAAARVAGVEQRRLAKDVEKGSLAESGAEWVDAARAAVLDRLAGDEPRTAAELRSELPELAGTITVGGPGKKWGGEIAVGPRVLGLLGAEGRIVRARNAGHWRLNKPTWTRTEQWLGDSPPPAAEADGYADLVRRWLWTFGPGTEDDIVWWLGSTKTAVRKALADIGAVEVSVAEDAPAWLLPDDLDEIEPVEPWGALLPTLDPTVMGWKHRAFYLGEDHRRFLFDTNGNAGNTAWWDGRIVGAWAQDDDARVHLLLREDIGHAGTATLRAEAERLTEWLDGVKITNVYASPQMKRAPLP